MTVTKPGSGDPAELGFKTYSSGGKCKLQAEKCPWSKGIKGNFTLPSSQNSKEGFSFPLDFG